MHDWKNALWEEGFQRDDQDMTQIRMPSEKICQTTWLGFSLKQLAKTISQGLDLLDQKGTSPRFLALPQQNQNINTLLTQSK